MANEPHGRKVAELLSPKGTEEVEFTQPKTLFDDIDHGDRLTVEKSFSDAYDAPSVPGGAVGTDNLRGSEEAVAFVRAFFEAGIRNAGGNRVDQEVVTDRGLVTSRYPGDLEAFCAKIVEVFAEGKHAGQARSA